jgi:hypothetical protein
MKKSNLFFTLVIALIVSSALLSGCGKPAATTYDETGYSGSFVGYHRLIDSANLSILGDVDFSFYDTLLVTNGTDLTDGKLYAKSSYLNGNTIEIDIAKTTSNITPKLIGTLVIGGTTLTEAKVGAGSNATWNTDKTTAMVRLTAGATFGVIVLPPSLRLWGDFTKL